MLGARHEPNRSQRGVRHVCLPTAGRLRSSAGLTPQLRAGRALGGPPRVSDWGERPFAMVGVIKRK